MAPKRCSHRSRYDLRGGPDDTSRPLPGSQLYGAGMQRRLSGVCLWIPGAQCCCARRSPSCGFLTIRQVEARSSPIRRRGSRFHRRPAFPWQSPNRSLSYVELLWERRDPGRIACRSGNCNRLRRPRPQGLPRSRLSASNRGSPFPAPPWYHDNSSRNSWSFETPPPTGSSPKGAH